jgi:hypothetical protein
LAQGRRVGHVGQHAKLDLAVIRIIHRTSSSTAM